MERDKMKMEQLESDLSELKNDFKEVKDALIGNKELGIKGIVHRLEYHSRYIEKDKTYKRKAVGFLAALQTLLTGIVLLFKFK